MGRSARAGRRLPRPIGTASADAAPRGASPHEYVCGDCGRRCVPADGRLGVGGGQDSPLMAELACRAGAEIPSFAADPAVQALCAPPQDCPGPIPRPAPLAGSRGPFVPLAPCSSGERPTVGQAAPAQGVRPPGTVPPGLRPRAVQAAGPVRGARQSRRGPDRHPHTPEGAQTVVGGAGTRGPARVCPASRATRRRWWPWPR